MQQGPVLIHVIPNKGRVKQSFLSSKVLGKGRGKWTRKKQTTNSHLGLFRAFPRVCKLHWVRAQHCSFLSTSVCCTHSSRKKVLAMIKPLPQVKSTADPCLFCDKHKIVLHSSWSLSACQRRNQGLESDLGGSYQKSDHSVGVQMDSPKQSLSLMLLVVFSKSVLLSSYWTKQEQKTSTHLEPGS